MGKRVPYGEVDLKKIRREGYLYIDKTMYIEKLESNSKIIFTRPRRFGKSMLTSMLGYYYSIGEAENFEEIFKGLYVYDHPTPYRNKYYILQFNFSGIDVSEYKTLDEIERSFNNKIQDSLGKFIGVNNLGITFDKTRTAAGMLSEVLMKFSELHKENNIYIMIDEYDHFTNGMLHGDAKRFLQVLGTSGFVRAFYEVIKENLEGINPPIGRFFATGVAPVTLDSLTSGFNIATKLTNNPVFTAMCGLTEEEIDGNIVDSFELENHFDKNDFLSMLFYNGYITIKSVGVRSKLKIPNYVAEQYLKQLQSLSI